MPIDKYFKGHGAEVMADMTKKYGAKKGKQMFYATANKKGMKPGGKGAGHAGHRMSRMLHNGGPRASY